MFRHRLLPTFLCLLPLFQYGFAETPGKKPAVTKGQAQTTASQDRPQIEVCFVLDTTGSMSGLIEGAKDKIWSIANEMLETDPAPDIKFGLIGYRDRGDAYVTKHFVLTSDLDQIHTDLMSFSAEGGGDTPESVNQALHEAVLEMNWSEQKEVLKIVFLVGDAPPHMDYDEVQYPEICKKAIEKDLIINTIQCGVIRGTDVVWKKIANACEGDFAAILQNGGTIAIKTPFDEQIAKLNAKLNQTVCAYGCPENSKEIESKLQSQSVAKSEAIADRAAFLTKNRQTAPTDASAAGAGEQAWVNCVVTGVDDLIEMLMDEKIQWEDVKKDQLPKELQALSDDELKKTVDAKIEQRSAAQKEMESLVAKRSEFITKEKAKLAAEGKVSGFDLQVKQMIRDQGSRKGIRYER